MKDAITEHVIVLIQQILALTQMAAKEILWSEVAGNGLTETAARRIHNAIGERSCEYADAAMTLYAKMELEASKSIAPERGKLITLEEHHE